MMLAVERDRLRPDVEAHPIADRGVADVERLGRRAGFELRRDDVIDGQLESQLRDPSACRDDVLRRVEQVGPRPATCPTGRPCALKNV